MYICIYVLGHTATLVLSLLSLFCTCRVIPSCVDGVEGRHLNVAGSPSTQRGWLVMRSISILALLFSAVVGKVSAVDA